MKIIRWIDRDQCEVESDGKRYLFTATIDGEGIQGYGPEARPRLSFRELTLAEAGIAVATPVAEWVKRPLRPGEAILERARGPQPQPREARSLVDAPGTTQPYACAWCGGHERDSLEYYHIGGQPNKVLLCRPGYGCSKEGKA